MLRRRRGRSRRVLYLVHALPPSENTGTPLVAAGYATAAAQLGWTATVVYAEPSLSSWDHIKGSADPAGFTRYGVPAECYGTWAVAAASAPSDPKSASSRFFARLLRDIRPDVVHIVDNVHLPLDWPELAAASGIPVIRTVSAPEDICGLTGPVSPLSGPLGYCESPLTAQRCAACLAAALGGTYAPDDGSYQPHIFDQLLAKRARAKHQYRNVFDKIVFATPGYRGYFEETIPLDPERVRVIEMGLDVERWHVADIRTIDAFASPIVFVLAGSLHPARGQQDAVHAFSRPELVGRDDYRLHIMGNGDESIVAPLLEVNPNVSSLGTFTPDDLPSLLAVAHVGISTSLFETFHRITREYFLAGLPIVANPTFGIQHLVVDGVNGLLYDRTDPAGLSGAVCTLLDNRPLLDRLAQGARTSAVQIRSVDQEMESLVGLYEEVAAQERDKR